MFNQTGEDNLSEGERATSNWEIALVTCSYSFLLLSILANCTIIRGLVGRHKKSTLVVILGANTLTNLLASLIMMPMTILTHTEWNKKLIEFGCKEMAQTSFYLRLLNFAAVTFLVVDRFLAVKCPDFYRECVTIQKALISVSAFWLLTSVFCLIASTNGINPSTFMPVRCDSALPTGSLGKILIPIVQILLQVLPITFVILTCKALSDVQQRKQGVTFSQQAQGRVYSLTNGSQQMDGSDEGVPSEAEIRASRNIQPVIVMHVILSVFHGLLLLPLYGDSCNTILSFEVLLFFLLIVLQSWMILLISPWLRRYLCVWRVKVVFHANRYPQIVPIPGTPPATEDTMRRRGNIPTKLPRTHPIRQISGTSTQIKFSVSSNTTQLELPPFLQGALPEERIRRLSNTSVILISESSRRGSISDDMEMSITYPINFNDGCLITQRSSSQTSIPGTCSTSLSETQAENPGKLRHHVGSIMRPKLSLTSVNSVDEHGFLTPVPHHQSFHHAHKGNRVRKLSGAANNEEPAGMHGDLPSSVTPQQKAQQNGQLALTGQENNHSEPEPVRIHVEGVEQDPGNVWAIRVENGRRCQMGTVVDKDCLATECSQARKAVSLPSSTYSPEERRNHVDRKHVSSSEVFHSRVLPDIE